MKNILPNNWVETELGNYIYLKNGYAFKTTQFTDSGIPILKISNITKSGKIDLSKVQYVNDKFLNESYLVKKGDILIAMSGATTGKIGIYENEELVLQNQRVGNIKLHSEKYGNKQFVLYVISFLKKEIDDRAYGGAQPNISPRLIESIKIPLPPLPEQERIVVKLNEIFARLEKIKDRIAFLKTLNNRFFESIFYQTNVLGKLFGKITERTDRVGANWSNHNKIGVSAKEGIIDLFVGDKKSFDNYKIVYPGDFIYNTMRINIGSIAIYEGKDIAITSPDYVVFKSESLSKYVLLNYLKSEAGLKNISAVTKGSVRSRLYFKSLITIPFPELTEQQHNLAETFLYTFNNNIIKLNSLKDTFFKDLQNSILHKAFKGELVEQLPTDGDAKDLLKEILELKNESAGKKKVVKNYKQEVEVLGKVAEGKN